MLQIGDTKKPLLFSALSVAVAVILLGYSAYGWYALNRQVTATGMNVKITAPDNLQIAIPTESEDFSSAVNFSFNKIVAKVCDGFNAETDKFSLLPASTYDGLSVWKTDSAQATGAALDNTVFDDVSDKANGYVAYRDFTKAYEGYYVDIPVWLRSASASATPLEVGLVEGQTKITRLDTSGSETVCDVVRVAFLDETAAASSNPGDKPLVFSQDTAAGYTAVTGASGSFKEPDFISFTDGISVQTVCKVNGLDSATGVYPVQKITVRVWLEGQDPACVAAIGQSRFSVDLGFRIKE